MMCWSWIDSSRKREALTISCPGPGIASLRRCKAGPGQKIAKTTPCKVEWTPARSTPAALRPGARRKMRRRHGPNLISSRSSLRCALAPISFELDCLVLSGFIKRRSPDLVRSLVFGAAKTELGSKAQVEIAHILQDVDEPFGIELWSGTFECLDQDVGRNVAFKRHVVRCYAGKIFGQGALVFENDARIAGNRRYNLRHDS